MVATVDRQEVLRRLDVYGGDLTRGVLPQDLQEHMRTYDLCAAALDGELCFAAFGQFVAEALSGKPAENVRGAIAKAEEFRTGMGRDDPIYHIGQFARTHLTLASAVGRDLNPQEIEENRRRLQDYRKVWESQS